MKSASFVFVIALVLVLLLLASFSPAAFALNDQALLKTAKTSAAHQRITGYYRQKAQRRMADSKFHDEMARI